MDEWFDIYTHVSVQYGPHQYKAVDKLLLSLTKLSLMENRMASPWDNIQELFA